MPTNLIVNKLSLELGYTKAENGSGSILLVFALIFSFKLAEATIEIPSWIFYIELGILILTIIPIEIALWRKFNKDGCLR